MASIVGSVPNAQGDRSLVRRSRAACRAPAALWHQRADSADGSQTPLFRKQARSRPAHLACQVISRSNAIRAVPLGRSGKRGFVDAGKVYDARSFALPSLLSRRKNEDHGGPRRRTLVRRRESTERTISLAKRSMRNLGPRHYFTLILSTSSPWPFMVLVPSPW